MSQTAFPTSTPETDARWLGYARRYNFFHSETYAAFALISATLIALLWANFGGESYSHFWHTEAGFDIAGMSLHFTFHEWVDEGLMTFFFFMVGLDVRRDLTLGELRNPRNAILPAAAAIGGLLIPALIYIFMSRGSGFEGAWGTVISTDTAFALGMLALIGPRNAPRLRAFLLAFAVIDDIGALSVIAIFYTEDLNVQALGFVALGLLVIWLLARWGVWRSSPYIVAGIFTWYAMYSSGIHATLAGVLIALLMPVYATRRADADEASRIFDIYRQTPIPVVAVTARDTLAKSIPLNQRLSDFLPGYVNYLVVPLFALANAGIVVTADSFSAAMGSAVTWGVIAGLVLGKLLGVVLGAGLVFWLLPSTRQPGLDLPRVAGIGALSGMGFTISLLVANMAIDDPVVQTQARMGVLLATGLALLLATIIFRLGDRFVPLEAAEGDVLARPYDPETDHLYGRVDAPIHLVFYRAYNPSHANQTGKAFLRTMEEMEESHQVAFTLRHKATEGISLYIALAIEAATAQGLYSPFLFEVIRGVEENPNFDCEGVREVARKVGVDVEEMDRRIQSGADLAKVERDRQDLPEELVESDDVIFYINGRRFDGPLNSWNIRYHLQEELDRLEAEKAQEAKA